MTGISTRPHSQISASQPTLQLIGGKMNRYYKCLWCPLTRKARGPLVYIHNSAEGPVLQRNPIRFYTYITSDRASQCNTLHCSFLSSYLLHIINSLIDSACPYKVKYKPNHIVLSACNGDFIEFIKCVPWRTPPAHIPHSSQHLLCNTHSIA